MTFKLLLALAMSAIVLVGCSSNDQHDLSKNRMSSDNSIDSTTTPMGKDLNAEQDIQRELGRVRENLKGAMDSRAMKRFKHGISYICMSSRNWSDAVSGLTDYWSDNKDVLTASTMDETVSLWLLKVTFRADINALIFWLPAMTDSQGKRIRSLLEEVERDIDALMVTWLEDASGVQRDSMVTECGAQMVRLASGSLDSADMLLMLSTSRDNTKQMAREEKFRIAQDISLASMLIMEYENTFLGDNAYRQQYMPQEDNWIQKTQARVKLFSETKQRSNKMMQRVDPTDLRAQ